LCPSLQSMTLVGRRSQIMSTWTFKSFESSDHHFILWIKKQKTMLYFVASPNTLNQTPSPPIWMLVKNYAKQCLQA